MSLKYPDLSHILGFFKANNFFFLTICRSEFLFVKLLEIYRTVRFH